MYIHILETDEQANIDLSCICMYYKRMKLQSLPCYCATLRQAARAATALYEEALSDSGVRSTQFTILQALKTAPDLQTTEIGQLLGIDQTTATRTLALMRKSKLLVDSTGADRRERRWRLSPLGETAYRRLLPKWESAQAMVEKRLGRAEAMALKKYAFHAANALQRADSSQRPSA
jgi:DNA-binding MarR family transcriptional regulator